MPSSKFNQRPVPKRRPPICIAPAGSCLPDYDLNNPPFLNAFIDWWDLDPLDPIGGRGYCILNKIGPEPTYYGESAAAGTRIGAEVWPTGAPPHWHVDAILFWEARPPAIWHFTNVWINPDLPFDSGLLRDINIPGQDYRFARILN